MVGLCPLPVLGSIPTKSSGIPASPVERDALSCTTVTPSGVPVKGAHDNSSAPSGPERTVTGPPPACCWPERGGSLVGRAASPYQGSPGAAKAASGTLALGLGGPRGFLVCLRGPGDEGTAPRPRRSPRRCRTCARPRSLGGRAAVPVALRPIHRAPPSPPGHRAGVSAPASRPPTMAENCWGRPCRRHHGVRRLHDEGASAPLARYQSPATPPARPGPGPASGAKPERPAPARPRAARVSGSP
jgi:hypothetical protein